MKRLGFLKGIFWQISLIGILGNFTIASGQMPAGQSSQIPENVNKIFQTSCISCHGSNGKLLALTKVNFSKWAEYGADKQAVKASLICSTLRKGAMPPESATKLNPAIIPSKEQVEIICKWAESLNSK